LEGGSSGGRLSLSSAPGGVGAAKRPPYRDPRWKALRTYMIERHGERCCDKEHDDSKPRVGVVIDLDHIVELEDNGAPFDPNNVMLRCHSCHMRKTKAVLMGRRFKDWLRSKR